MPTFERNSTDVEIAHLHKEATRLAAEGKQAEAIEALRRAEALMRSPACGTVYPTTQWTRLPLYLQAAGQFDASMAQFEALLSEVEERVLREVPRGHIQAVYMRSAHHRRATIFDKMRLACVREGLRDRAAEYRRRHEEEEQAAEALRETVKKSYSRTRRVG